MVAVSDVARACLEAGELLKSHWICPDDPMDWREEEGEQIRDAYLKVQDDEPNNVAGLVGLTLLAFADLRAHIVHDYSAPLDWCEDDMWRRGARTDAIRFPTVLKEADEAGRTLAEDAADMARVVLDRQPDNSLAAFALARSLEWLGDHAAAVNAHREALAIDPYDEAARSRLAALDRESLHDMPERPTADNRPPVWHPHGFYVVELTEPLNHSGDRRGVLALLNNSSMVRSLVEDYLRSRSGEMEDEEFTEWMRGWLAEETLTVWSNLPGTNSVATDLRDVLCAASAGGWGVDWSQVAMADPLVDPLPAGCPVRWRGGLLFFGTTTLT